MKKKLTKEYILKNLKILPIEKVFPHEAVIPSKVYSIRAFMNSIDYVCGKRLSPNPILVTLLDENKNENQKTYLVLDGMHRYQACKEYKLPYVFAFEVDYEKDVELGGWDALLKKKINFQEVLEKTTEDFKKLEKDEVAGGIEIEWKIEEIDLTQNKTENLYNTLKQWQKKVDDDRDGYPFILIIKEQNKLAIYYPVKSNQSLSFTLEERIQLQKDFDESVEICLSGEEGIVYLSSENSIEEFINDGSCYGLIFRARFTKDEIKKAVKKGILLPKKTTRHKFLVRPLVQIDLSILEDPFSSIEEKEKQMKEFIESYYSQPRLYEEPIYNFGDVISFYDQERKAVSIEEAEKKKRELLNDPRLKSFCKEWMPPLNVEMFLPGPVGFTDLEITGGFWQGNIVSHRSEEFSELYRMTSSAVKWLLVPDKDPVYRDLEVYILPGPTSHAMAIAALSAVSYDKTILHIVAGAFGQRWVEISKNWGQRYETFYLAPGEIFSEEKKKALKEILLSAQGEIGAVSVVFNETSTGTCYPLDEIYEVIKEVENELEKDILFLVDAASAFGGMEIPALKYIDFLVLSTEKCLALPPGISLLAVNSRGIAHAHKLELLNQPVGYTTSLMQIRKYYLKGQTLGTPPIPQIIMLLKAIQKISGYISYDGRYVPGEGKENRFNRYKELSKLCRNWVKKIGFKLVPHVSSPTEEKYYSSTITAFYTDPFPFEKIIEKIRTQYNIILAGSHRHLKDKYGNVLNVLRIPHMGMQTKKDLCELLKRITKVILELVKEESNFKFSEIKKWKEKCELALKFLEKDCSEN